MSVGLTSATVLRYQRFAGRFLAQRASRNGGVLGCEGLTSVEINDYLLAALRGWWWSPPNGKPRICDRCCGSRTYADSSIPTSGATMPPVAAWRATRLPQGLSAAKSRRC